MLIHPPCSLLKLLLIEITLIQPQGLVWLPKTWCLAEKGVEKSCFLFDDGVANAVIFILIYDFTNSKRINHSKR